MQVEVLFNDKKPWKLPENRHSEAGRLILKFPYYSTHMTALHSYEIERH